MRYDTPVTFLAETTVYDPETGNYASRTRVVHQALASVMDTSADMLGLVYGKLRQGSLTVHFQNHVLVPFQLMRIGGRTYQLDKRRTLRTKETFIVSEVQ